MRRGDERGGGNAAVAALLEEAQVALAYLIRSHAATDLRPGSRLCRDSRVSGDEVARVQAGDLPRRGALCRPLQLDLHLGVVAGGGSVRQAARDSRPV